MFFLPSDLTRSSEEREKDYFLIVERVLEQVHIPVALKISSSFSTLAQMIERLSRSGRRGARPVQPLLLDRLRHREDGRHRIPHAEHRRRSSPPPCAGSRSCRAAWDATWRHPRACTTGPALIKLLLAGAKAVQAVSAFYRKGPRPSRQMLAELGAGWTGTATRPSPISAAA